jgi:Leucine-rich repeat (LRR) protein
LLLTNCHIDPALPIARLSNIRKLEFDGMDDLFYLPDDLWQLPNLRELYVVNGHKLEHIPDDITTDAKLEKLHLNEVNIVRLPSSLCALNNLTSLEIVDSDVEILPDNFTQLTSLRNLNIVGTNITRLPPNMERLVNMEEVHFAGSSLDIGGAFSKLMPSMRRLRVREVANADNIDWSGLTGLAELETFLGEAQSQLHPSIGCLRSLGKLKLDCGGLTTLPAEIGQLTSLASLHLVNPQDDFTLPEAISGLVSLRELSVNSDFWVHMPQAMQLPTSLTQLDLYGGIAQLPASLTTLLRLRVLAIECMEPTLDSLPALRNMPSLRLVVLRFSDTHIDQRVSEMLAHAVSLTHLFVQGQLQGGLAPVYDVLPTLTGLRHLRLMLPEDEDEVERYNVPEPAALDIPSSISSLTSLTYLFLDSPCAQIPPAVFLLPSLQVLEFQHDSTCYAADELAPPRLSPAISNLVNLRRLLFSTDDILMCAAITSLTKLTEIRHPQHDYRSDSEHWVALQALRARGVTLH